MKKNILAVLGLLLCGCGARDNNLKPVVGFELTRYLGTWYEIARFEHSFEKGLSKVTAQYSLLPNGKVQVLNQGFDEQSAKWKKATGYAQPAGAADIGELKVSFFRPFYAPYIILELDKENYSYALVSSSNLKYLWILARKPVLDTTITANLTDKAKTLGFDTGKLIFVKQGE